MVVTKTEIKEFASSIGLPICGFAGVDRFATSPEGAHPSDILPGCKSVIVIGAPLLDGVIQINFRAFEEGKKNMKGIYGTYGYSTLPNFELTYACYAIARHIETNTNSNATPCSTGPMTNGFQISIRHAAAAAGLGELGHMGIMLTPEHGPRIRFGVILTTLELEADPMYDGPKLCNAEKCGICVKVCPTGALSPYAPETLKQVRIGGKQYEYPLINIPKCTKALLAMTKELGGNEDYLKAESPTFADIAEAQAKMPPYNHGLAGSSWHCGRCQSYCPVGNWGTKFKKTGLSSGPVFYEEKV